LDFGIIGISGIGADGALLDFDFREVKVSQAILKNARTVILAADASKFERRAMVKQGHLSQVDYLVSDKSLPNEIQEIVKQNDIAFIKA
jgi:DeoR family glycerol-3-phosphate regulon repressor